MTHRRNGVESGDLHRSHDSAGADASPESASPSIYPRVPEPSGGGNRRLRPHPKPGSRVGGASPGSFGVRAKMGYLSKNRQRIMHRVLVGTLVVLSLTIASFYFAGSLPRHPTFGAVYAASASEVGDSQMELIKGLFRRYIPRRVLQSSYFPSRFKDQSTYLRLGNTQLEWSTGGQETGWLYFWQVDVWPKTPCWEVALSANTNLMEVTTIPSDFCGASDPRRAAVFGEISNTNALRVAEGQILFARTTQRRDRTYVMLLQEQRDKEVLVRYCVATQ